MLPLLLVWGLLVGVTSGETLRVEVTPAFQESLKAHHFPPLIRDTLLLLRTLRNGEALWVLIDDIMGKHEPITYAVGVRDTEVVFVKILRYREPYGGEIQNPRFLERFRGKSLHDPFQVGKDIPYIAGATISVNAMAVAVRRSLWILQYLRRKGVLR